MSKKLTHEEFIARVIEKNEHVRNGEIEILEDYKGVSTGIKCKCIPHNYIYYPRPNNLYKNCGCPQCGHEAGAKKTRSSQDHFVEQLHKIRPEITLCSNYINNKTKVCFECEKGHIWWARPDVTLSRGGGCPYCSNHKILVGFNDLWTTAPEIAKLLKNKEDGYTCSMGSNKKLEFICSDCGAIIKLSVHNVVIHGLSCSMCGDGISYPNKFGCAFIQQLPVTNYEREWNDEWCKQYLYDNYFEYNNQKFIVEMHGLQHFEETGWNGHTLEEIQKRDLIKATLAKHYGICVIHINCAKSDPLFIKNSILHSELSNIFCLDNINWEMCNCIAQKNIVKEACAMYCSGTYNTQLIANCLKIHQSTVIDYLHRGHQLGWCDYHPFNTSIPVAIVYDNGDIIQQFKSVNECVKTLKSQYNITIYHEKIKYACETRTSYNGFNFRYLNSTIQN